MLSWKKRWPRVRLRATASDDWFPDKSSEILLHLLELSGRAIEQSFGDERTDLSTAFLLPFVGRLSCSVPGDIVTHVKKGASVFT